MHRNENQNKALQKKRIKMQKQKRVNLIYEFLLHSISEKTVTDRHTIPRTPSSSIPVFFSKNKQTKKNNSKENKSL